MRFVWAPEKDKINVRKHNISFTQSCYVFSDPYSLTLFDESHSEYEDRWVTLGQIQDETIMVVVHTFRDLENDEVIRIVSARKATKRERQRYQARRK